ncbi:putative uncharacterized protein [Pseudomonas sp. StFLB209]|uniref:hypothetical protein n=1 Tax=Pseudomonas sp. StFLB209 TaxID=1028989 RepID=UPI0004F7C717|nr:hypothetical protein [Pseudomonas sp. StFLB209]BAP45373.1 putative uncharacterized protein [Pseudomonas sp. StFLB209]
MQSLAELTAVVRQDDFFQRLLGNIDNWDAVLDLRDSASFDSSWVQACTMVDCHEHVSPEAAEQVRQLREYVFKSCFRITRNAEIAACVSDDMGLLGDALGKQMMTPWLRDMLAAYCSERFPS